MRKLSLYLLFVILFFNVQAQETSFEIEKGNVKRDKITKRTYGIEPIAYDEESFYYLYLPYIAVFGEISHGSVENYFIAKFNKKTLEEVEKKEIILDYNNRKRQFHGVFYVKNKLYLFSAFQNEQHKKHYLFMQNVNKETLELEDNMKKIGEIDYSGINRYNNTYFHHEFSPDSSKILVYYNIVNKKNENLRYGMYVYTEQMELLWKKENVVPTISDGVFAFQKFRIDNDGNVYIKGTNYTNLENYYASSNFKDRGFFSKDTYYADFPNYTIQLYKFTDNGAKQSHINLSIQDKFIRSLTFLPKKNGEIICAGIYSNPGTISAKGTFIFDLDFENKKVSDLQTKEFSNELIELGFDEKQLKRFRKSIDNKEEWDPFDYVLSDIRTDDKGEKYFIAEQVIRGTKVEKSGNMTVYSAIFLNNDIFVAHFGDKNLIHRIDKISKQQYLINTSQFNSYAVLEIDGKLYFVFKEFRKKDSMLKNIEEGNSYVVELDTKGNQTRTMYQSSDSKDDLFIIPETGIETSEDHLIYSTINGKYKDYAVNKLVIK